MFLFLPGQLQVYSEFKAREKIPQYIPSFKGSVGHEARGLGSVVRSTDYSSGGPWFGTHTATHKPL